MVAGPWPMHYFMISSPISWALHLGNIISPYTQWWGMGTKLTPSVQRTGQVTTPNVKWRGWRICSSVPVCMFPSVSSECSEEEMSFTRSCNTAWPRARVVQYVPPSPLLLAPWLLYPGLQHEMGTGIILTYHHQGKLGTMLWRLHSFLKLHTS